MVGDTAYILEAKLTSGAQGLGSGHLHGLCGAAETGSGYISLMNPGASLNLRRDFLLR
jgi:hypothetical protein